MITRRFAVLTTLAWSLACLALSAAIIFAPQASDWWVIGVWVVWAATMVVMDLLWSDS